MGNRLRLSGGKIPTPLLLADCKSFFDSRLRSLESKGECVVDSAPGRSRPGDKDQRREGYKQCPFEKNGCFHLLSL